MQHKRTTPEAQGYPLSFLESHILYLMETRIKRHF